MSHPLLWPDQTFFYPYGNVAPVLYTQDLIQDEPADVLLLGCGDPMSILYTVHSDRQNAQATRNVILLTLLAQDDVHDNLPLIWNIFFDFFLDKPSLSLLFAHCQRLLDISKSMDAWIASPYHRFISFCDVNTLATLRGFWQLYLQSSTSTEQEHKRSKATFVSVMKETIADPRHFSYSPIRSAGPLGPLAMFALIRGFQRFWATGVASYDKDTLARAQYVNPTFVYSRMGDRFKVNKGTYPLTCFFLAESFAIFRLVHPEKLDLVDDDLQDNLLLNEVIPDAKKQFYAWCTTFANVLRQEEYHVATPSYVPPVTMRLFHGEALAFCKALRVYRDTNVLETPFVTAPWSSSCINLSSPSPLSSSHSSLPTSFDVIDTSNLTDHLGLLNILTHVNPLLKRSPFSALYTETLIPQRGNKDTESAVRGLLDRACCDLGVLSLLLGLAPTSFVSGFTTYANGFEVCVHSIMNWQLLMQYHERLLWRRPMPACAIVKTESDGLWLSTPGSVSFVPEELAGVLHGIYLRMFADENMSACVTQSVHGHYGDISLPDDQTHASTYTHYTRRSFAELLVAVRDQLFPCTGKCGADGDAVPSAEWSRMMSTLFDLLRKDRTMLISHYIFQDLCGQLHLLGLHTADFLEPDDIDSQRHIRGAVFRGWRTVPATVSVVLVVPWHRFSKSVPLLDELGTPPLQCEICGPTTHHIFPSFNIAYGTAVDEYHDSEFGGKSVRVVGARERAAGLVIAFEVPVSVLMAERGLHAALALRATPYSESARPVLGWRLHVFDSAIEDARHVHIVARSPFTHGASSAGPSAMGRCVSGTRERAGKESGRRSRRMGSIGVKTDAKREKVASMAARVDVVDTGAKKALAEGASVAMILISTCAVRVTWHGHTQVHAFPLPVDFENTKLRIARKSSYLEVVAPVATAMRTHGAKFPVFLTNKGPALWNIPRVDLDSLPLLDLPNDDRVSRWVIPHIGNSYTLSRDFTVLIRKQAANDIADRPLLDLKQLLYWIMSASCGENGHHAPVALCVGNPWDDACSTLIFVTGLRLDLTSHAVVADAWVLTLTPAIAQRLPDRALHSLAKELVELASDARDMLKHLLPAATERCRTWAHNENCEYRAKGTVPLTNLDSGADPICSCGRGVGTSSELPFRQRWKAFAPFVTRAALGPLFPVLYLETLRISAFGESRKADTIHDDVCFCAACGSGGRVEASLQVCKCQRKDWKRHKLLDGRGTIMPCYCVGMISDHSSDAMLAPFSLD
ncbi:hypothetical protein CONPUDRAFT_73808 [Coniophora puteana RWD-64-598 SS2]|uniref:DUF4470 domain-containing protein n=1 Tax=Coniophora puteana (strain RWD-64-598) TaxID=741705 RepID=A0A5M3MPX7_CONPW|nr:uncharacterized protein CONPUDRAFT_73808 [Coniophora puteana RWD-64-598 SS2]EIW80764.1 hypothetical protein CONPUDRAFT_73808 [Coniophora puteana RWD-64-598 SS2]